MYDAPVGIGARGSFGDFSEQQTQSTFSAPPGQISAGHYFAATLLAGTYYSPGYGPPFTLCAPSSKGIMTTSYCAQVKDNFTAISPDYSGDGELIGQWSRVWSSHIRMSPTNSFTSRFSSMHGNKTFAFHIDLARLFVHGYGKDNSPFFQTEGPAGAEARFVVNEADGRVYGFGLFGTIDGLEDGITDRERRTRGKTAEIERGADTWFMRMDEESSLQVPP